MDTLLTKKVLLENIENTKKKPLGSSNTKARKDLMGKQAGLCVVIIFRVEIYHFTLLISTASFEEAYWDIDRSEHAQYMRRLVTLPI